MRQRATAVIFRDGKVLLVKDRGQHRFSLPGGAIKRNEPATAAAAREVYEELGLHVSEVKRLPERDYAGSTSQHRVSLVATSGEPHIREELDAFKWWDRKESIPTFPHVQHILAGL